MLNKDNKDEIIEFLKNRIIELKDRLNNSRPCFPLLMTDEYGDQYICEHDARLFETEIDNYIYDMTDICDKALMETTF